MDFVRCEAERKLRLPIFCNGFTGPDATPGAGKPVCHLLGRASRRSKASPLDRHLLGGGRPKSHVGFPGARGCVSI